MSGNTNSPIPTFTISVGTPGSFSNEESTDISAEVNAEIKAAPAGDHINLVFNPGSYGVGSPILVRSNTSVIGTDATLNYIQEPGSLQNFGLIANADAYYTGTQVYENQTNGTSTVLQTWSQDDNGNTQTMSGNVPGLVDTNISVQGLTFNLGTTHEFGTWFTNAQNIDVQNNSYVGGVDGNAFVDVVNGVVANNLAIGQINAAFDDWNGPTSITIADNATYMSSTPNSGWSVLMNSTPSGNTDNPGNAVNDGIVDNLFSEGTPGQSAVNANALVTYGFTSEALIVQQGNIDSANGLPNSVGIYTGNPMQNLFVQNDVTSGINDSGTNTQLSYGYIALSSNSTGPNDTNQTSIDGNIVEGNFSGLTGSVIQNSGNSPSTTNNLVVGAGANGSDISTNVMGGSSAQYGNMTIGGQEINGSVNAPLYDIQAPPTILVQTGLATPISDIAVTDGIPNDSLSVTLLAHFGTISFSTGGDAVTSENINGENAYILSGNVSDINTELSALSYTSNSAGWDDSIEMVAANGSGIVAARYLPIIDFSGTEIASDLISISSSNLADFGIQPNFVNGTLSGPNFSGGAILAPFGDNTVAMGSSVSVVMLGTGTDQINGGANDGYIATGQGTATINLTNGGDFTIAGGSGVLDVNALNGDNLIQSGAGNLTLAAGPGANTILGGLGNISFAGGTGRLEIETLPQDGGLLAGTVGAGGGTIYALSGNADLVTSTLALDLLYLGLGNDFVQSAGDDLIYTGAGNATINSSMGGTDFIVGGSGRLDFVGGNNPAVIDPAHFSKISEKSGDMTINSGGSFSLKIDAISSGHRIVVLPGLSEGVVLHGYSDPGILQESIVRDILTVTLNDGTQIEMPDITGQTVEFIHGAKTISSHSTLAIQGAHDMVHRRWHVEMLGGWAPELGLSGTLT